MGSCKDCKFFNIYNGDCAIWEQKVPTEHQSKGCDEFEQKMINCSTCEHFQSGKCLKCGQEIPEQVQKVGCKKWEDRVPF